MANIYSTITYNANLSPAQAQLKALTAQVAGLNAAFNNLDRSAVSAQKSLASAFARDVGNIGGFSTQMVKANSAVENFGKNLANNRLTMREYFREAITGYTKQNSLMQQLAAQQVKYQQSVAVPMGQGQTMMLTPTSLAATGTAAAMASQKFAVFNELVNGGATSMLNWGKNTQWAGRQLMVGFTVPLAMFTAVASKQFRELDKELTRFQKVYGQDLGGAMTEATTRMRDQVQALAYDISAAYGIAAKDTAALAADIAATGKEGADLLNSIEQTTRLSVLGEVDRQEAMKATLSLQSAFRLNTDELTESINFLNAVENQTSATLEDLATAIPKVGPVVRSLGGDIEDLSILLVAMREGGIPAAEAANALKSGLASLINPTKQASEVAKKFGVDLQGIVSANQGQLMPTIYAMQDALSGLDSFARSQVIEQIFGKYQFARMTALFDNIGRVGSQTQSVIELASKSSAELAAIANKEIKILTESTAVKFQRTLEELKNAIIPIGQTLTETLIPILSFIGDGIKKFSSFFENLPGPIKDFAKLGIAIAALAGPVIMIVGLFANLIANGIKFGMMVTRLGARIAGFKVEAFQLLNSEVMAAKFGVDNLTTSFVSQETAMKRLIGVLSSYEASLRRIQVADPSLFIPGAVPARGGRIPIKRQTGGIIPGYGGGDIVPAYLEPGEFVIRKEATRRNRGFLETINSGKKTNGYKDGKSSDIDTAAGSGQGSIGRAAKLHTVSPDELGKMYYGPRSKKMLGVLGYGGLTTTLHPQYINNTFDKLTGIPQWMKAGIPFNDEAAAGMLKTLKEKRDSRGGKVGPEFTNSIKYLEDLVKVKNKGKARSITLNGYASTTAAAERMAGIIPDTDKAQKIRTQQLALELNKNIGTATSPGRIFSVINRLSMDYIDKAIADPNRRKLIWESTPGTSKSQFKDSLRERLPKYAQSGVLFRGIRSLRYQKGGIGTGEQALVEPGEFIVNSEASSRYSRVLHAMNKGNIKGYVTGKSNPGPNLPNETVSPSGIIIPGSSATTGATTTGSTVKAHINAPMTVPASSLLALQGLSDSARASLLAITANGDVLVKVFSNLVVALQKTTNSALNTGTALASTVSAELKSAAAWEIITKNTGLSMQDLQPVVSRVTGQLDLLGDEMIDDPRLYQMVETQLTELAAAGDKAAIVLQTLGRQYGVMADPSDPRQHRKELGAGIAPAYKTERTGTGKPLQAIPYVDLRQYSTDPRTARAAAASATAPIRMIDTSATGPGKTMQDPMAKAMRGQGLMNVAFMGSMLVSSFGMAAGASEDLASKLNLLTMALMALPLLQSFSAKGMATNFLGLGKLGSKFTEMGVTKQAAAAAKAPAFGTKWVKGAGEGLVPAGTRAGAGLLTAGRALSFLGGPPGIAIGLGITGIVTAYMLYKKAADEARERAIASFEDPVKSAEYFGETVDDLAKELEERNLRFAPQVDMSGVDQGLRDVVKEEYAPLIDRLKYSQASDGARQLALAYNNMIINGLSAENAKETLKAIAIEAGTQGGLAYGEAFTQSMTDAKSIEEALQSQLDLLNPEKNKVLVQKLQSQIPVLEEQAKDASLNAQLSSYKYLGSGLSKILLPALNLDTKEITISLDKVLNNFTTGLTQIWEATTGSIFDSTAEERAADAASNAVDQVKTSLKEMSTMSADTFAATTEDFMKAYEDAPQKVIEIIQTSSQWLDDSAQNVDALKQKLMELQPALGGLISTLKNPEQISLFYQLLTVGADPTRFFDENGFMDAAAAQTVTVISYYDEMDKNNKEAFDKLKENTIDFIDGEIKATNKGINKVNDYWDSWAKVTRKEQRQAEEDYEKAQRRSEKFIDAKENEIEVIQDAIDKKRDEFDERMQGYEDEAKAIEESSDAYIKSLEERKKADSFYAQQKETSLGALQKLASGDVFGFLQEREQMSSDAQQYSYDEMISGIEDRRDSELKVIEDTMEAERRRQDEWEKMQEQKIDGINDLIDAENDLMDERTKSHEKEMRQFEKKQKTIEINRRQDLKDDKEKLKTLQKARQDAEGLELSDYEKMTEVLGEAYKERYDKVIVQLQREQYYIRLNTILEQEKNAIAAGQAPRTQEEMKVQAYTEAFGQRPGPAQGGSLAQNIDQTLASLGMFPYGPGQGGQSPPVPNAMGGYINNGKVERFSEGTGGRVTGPGGPKSDVIPALLSNGEYVVRASSVKKYGKGMMDAVNQGKFADGGVVQKFEAGGMPGTSYRPTKPSSNATAYYGGTPTASNYTSRVPGPYDYTPGWDASLYNLPRQRYGPAGVGRIPRTTKPFMTPAFNRTADMSTMLSHGYSHKLDAYATTDDYKKFLLNKSGQTYIPGYGYSGGQPSGGEKWQSLMGLTSSPFGTGARQRLTSSARDMPTLGFWRTLSREQKAWFTEYANTGKISDWSNEKTFRLMPWLPPILPKIEKGIPGKLRVPVDRGPIAEPMALLSYSNTVTIDGANYVWDGKTGQYIKLSDVDRPLGGPPNPPPSYDRPQAYRRRGVGEQPPTPYPWWWDKQYRVPVNTNEQDFGTWNIPNDRSNSSIPKNYMGNMWLDKETGTSYYWHNLTQMYKNYPPLGFGEPPADGSWTNYGKANGGIVQRFEAGGQVYQPSKKPAYYGGTPTSTYSPSKYNTTPGWNPSQFSLPPQRYGPSGVGRIPRTTSPFMTPAMNRTADLSTMLSHGYSHKLDAYATTKDYQQFLLNKSGQAYTPGYINPGGEPSGGKKWQSLMSSISAPSGIGSTISERLQSLVRDSPTPDFWRTLSREQKEFVINYSTKGQLEGWSNEKIFRLMPWLPQEKTTSNLPINEILQRNRGLAQQGSRSEVRWPELWPSPLPSWMPAAPRLKTGDDWVSSTSPGGVGGYEDPLPSWMVRPKTSTTGDGFQPPITPGAVGGWNGPWPPVRKFEAGGQVYQPSKPTYSGGTPTYSGGYTSSNSQSNSKIYNKNKSIINYGKVQNYDSNIVDPNSMDSTNSLLGSMWNSLLSGAAASLSTTGLGGINSVSTLRPNSQNKLVMDESAQYRLPAQIAGMTPQDYANIPESQRILEAALFTSSFIPGQGILASMGLSKAASLLGRSMATGSLASKVGLKEAVPAGSRGDQRLYNQLIDQKYGDEIIAHLTRASDDPAISGFPAGMRLESHLGPSTEALSAFGHNYALTQAAKNKAAQTGAELGIKPIKVMSADRITANINTAMNAMNKSEHYSRGLINAYDQQPNNVIRFFSKSDPEFAALSMQEKSEVVSFLRSTKFNAEEAKDLAQGSAGFDNPRWTDGQVNMFNPNAGRFDLLSTLSHEMGHTTDFMYGRSGYGRLQPRGIPENANPLQEWYLSTRNKMDMVKAYGKSEAYAESNRLRAMLALQEDIGVDPSLITRFTKEGGGVGPYTTGVIPNNPYSNSPLFKYSYARQMRSNMKGEDSLFDIRRFSMGKSGIYSDLIKSTPNWISKQMLQKMGLIKGYDDGGIVQKFEAGGQPYVPSTDPTQSQGGGPNTYFYEAKEAGVNGGHNEYSYSQNGWPYLSGYSAGQLQSGIIPGTNASIQTHADVLPLFLAIAGMYNSKIRKIDESQTAGFGFRGNQTNHRSGTALDINWSEEGTNSDAPQMYDWWSGKSNPAAPWSKLSPNPAQTAVGMKNYFNQFGEIIEWYGSSRLGGDLISGQGLATDWMHWQISQKTKPGPERIKEVMAKLGLTTNGGVPETTGTPGTTGGAASTVTSTGEVMIPPPGGLYGVLAKIRNNLQTSGTDNTTTTPGSEPGSEPVSDGSGPKWLKEFILSKGIPDKTAQTLWAIAMRESNGNPSVLYPQRDSYDWNSSGQPYFDTGLFQINNRHLELVKSMFGSTSTMQDMLDYEKNFLVMKKLSSDFSRWNAWGIGSDQVTSDWTGWPETSWSKDESFNSYLNFRDQYANYAAGGFIRGPGGPRSDVIPAMLSNGEYVIKAASVSKYGKGFMDKVNSGQLDMVPRYAKGGMIGKSGGMNYAGGGMVGVGASMPSFNLPQSQNNSMGVMNNTNGGNTSSNTANTKVNVTINGASGKNARAIANEVVSMINKENNRRDHSRSI